MWPVLAIQIRIEQIKEKLTKANTIANYVMLVASVLVLIFCRCSSPRDFVNPDSGTDSDTDTDTDSDTDSDTGIPCQGITIENGCWYVSGKKEGCADFCASHGAEYDPLTCDYAGENMDDCFSVVMALHADSTGDFINAGTYGGAGCCELVYHDPGFIWSDISILLANYCVENSWTYYTTNRACACSF